MFYVTPYERFAPIKDAPSDSEVTRAHSLLTSKEGFFIDRELTVMLSRGEAASILRTYLERSDTDNSTLGDLITREEIRQWSNLPDENRIIDSRCISLMSVFEYMLKRDGGIVESPGKFPLDGNQVALQKDVLRRILAQVPDWQTRFLSNMATLTGPTPPGVGV